MPHVVDIISDILSEEDVLHRLELLQALDLIDVEGAHQIMLRLEHLTGSSEDALSALQCSIGLPYVFSLPDLCNHCWSIRNGSDKEHYCSSSSQCIDVKRRYGGAVADLLDMQIHSYITDEKLVLINNRAMHLTGTLNQNDCIVFLRLLVKLYRHSQYSSFKKTLLYLLHTEFLDVTSAILIEKSMPSLTRVKNAFTWEQIEQMGATTTSPATASMNLQAVVSDANKGLCRG
jgi:hypothetical protein